MSKNSEEKKGNPLMSLAVLAGLGALGFNLFRALRPDIQRYMRMRNM